MSIKLLQRETTYSIIYKEKEYTITVLEDKISVGYTQYDVYDSKGKIVEGDLEEEIINFLEEKAE